MPGIRGTGRRTRRWPAALLALLLVGCADLVTNLSPWGSVEVDAVRRSGEPVPGVQLVLYTGTRPMGYATTGADGRYVFRYVPKSAWGAYGVYATPPEGYVRPEELFGGASTAVVAPLTLGEGEHIATEFTYLKVGPGTIIVHAADSLTGTPAQGVQAELYGPGAVLRTDTTDPAGTVRFDSVPFGNWGVLLTPPPLYRDTGEEGVSRDGLYVEEGVTDTVGVRFLRCDGMVHATVQDSHGEPVPGYPLEVYDTRSVVATGATGGDGVKTFPSVACGDHGVQLLHLDLYTFRQERGQGFVDGIVIHRGSEHSVVLHVTRCAGRIRVHVHDTGGGPVPGAGLTLYDSRQSREEEVTDGGGEYTFQNVPCAIPLGVKVTPPEGYTVRQGRGLSYVDGLFVTNDAETEVTFVLTRG